MVRVYETKTWKLIREFSGNRDYILSVTFSHDGTKVASGGIDSILRVYSLEKHGEADNISSFDNSSSRMQNQQLLEEENI